MELTNNQLSVKLTAFLLSKPYSKAVTMSKEFAVSRQRIYKVINDLQALKWVSETDKKYYLTLTALREMNPSFKNIGGIAWQ